MKVTGQTEHARLHWLDNAKGIGIILVVFSHCLIGCITSGIVPSSEFIQTVDAALYSLHMPTFFFLAGHLVKPLPNELIKEAAISRAVHLMWPFVVWWSIQGPTEVLASSLKNHPVTLQEFLRGYIDPKAQFWFLPTLLIANLATFLAMRSAPARWRQVTLAFALLIFPFQSLDRLACYFIFFGTSRNCVGSG